MEFLYRTAGCCAREIAFGLDENNNVTNIRFHGGCNGNLKMIAKLLEGQSADFIISKCSGNLCGAKNTSCADQLAEGVKAAVAKKAEVK